MTDIVERLRSRFDDPLGTPALMREAADEIERLEGFFKLIISAYESGTHADLFCLQVARDALKDKKDIDPNLVYPGKNQDFVFPEEP